MARLFLPLILWGWMHAWLSSKVRYSLGSQWHDVPTAAATFTVLDDLTSQKLVSRRETPPAAPLGFTNMLIGLQKGEPKPVSIRGAAHDDWDFTYGAPVLANETEAGNAWAGTGAHKIQVRIGRFCFWGVGAMVGAVPAWGHITLSMRTGAVGDHGIAKM
jgi:hypothetical protein